MILLTCQPENKNSIFRVILWKQKQTYKEVIKVFNCRDCLLGFSLLKIISASNSNALLSLVYIAISKRQTVWVALAVMKK